MYGWNDFFFKNVLGAAYNQVRFIVRNLRYTCIDTKKWFSYSTFQTINLSQ